ncbi:unnamed protein product [Paramecium sonneborni]|uniref:Uncharacterized protein n=1 Tax=Paramecium sonneborni TaxID=65129 RepID=A0A8S1NGX8_9CILI|nr:unnamed protein product [Paramecium sonneborni]
MYDIKQMESLRINDSENQENKYQNLLPSGYQTPKLNISFRHWLYMSQYERQIIRSLLSSNIQRIPQENSYIYLVNYDSELQIFKYQGEQVVRSTLKNGFCSFVTINKSSKNPKIINSFMVDRNNIIHQYEMDFSRTKIEERKEELEINKQLNLENATLLACVMNPNGSLFVTVSETTIYILDQINELILQLQNPLKIKYFPYQFNFEQKVFLELSPCNKCLILAHQSLIFIYWNNKLIKKFELKKEQIILNIKLFKEQLIIITNMAIIKIENIFNIEIQLQQQDYFYPLKKEDVKISKDFDNYIQYGTFEIENQELKSIIIQDRLCKLYLIEMQSIQQGSWIMKEIKMRKYNLQKQKGKHYNQLY